MSDARTTSNVWRLLVTGASIASDLVQHGHRKIASLWPHGVVNGSPAPQGQELDAIGKWMKLPRSARGTTLVGDDVYRATLQQPFSWHGKIGTIEGLIRAVESLGYTGVTYLFWYELRDCPTWTPPGETTPVLNQNAFGLMCNGFPTNWIGSDGIPVASGEVSARLRSVIQTVLRTKRASAKFWEVRSTYAKVVTQAWWEGGQVGDPGYVCPKGYTEDAYVIVKRGGD